MQPGNFPALCLLIVRGWLWHQRERCETRKKTPFSSCLCKPDFIILFGKRRLGLPAHTQHFAQKCKQFRIHGLGDISLSQMCGERGCHLQDLHYLLQEPRKCAVNKMVKGEVSWDGLLNTARENLIFFLSLPEFHRDLNHITSLTFFTSDACMFFNFWFSYLSPSAEHVEMKLRTLGVSSEDRESSAWLWRNTVQWNARFPKKVKL